MYILDAQLTVSPPSEPVCPGIHVIFTCQQSGAIARWNINLQSDSQIRFTVQDEEVGSIITIGQDSGFEFQLHIVSISSANSNITTELQVTAARELDGVTVECIGNSGMFVSTIRVASVGELNIH